MSKITFQDKHYLCHSDETVLDALLRHNVDASYACRAGVCQSCLMRSIDGQPPKQAQEGLKPGQKLQNYFLSCLCKPEQDMTITSAENLELATTGKVIKKQKLGPSIIQLILECDEGLAFKAGQFVNLTRPDGLSRSYSIANVPNELNRLEFHIRHLSGGQFSEWVFNELLEDECLGVSHALGDCFYSSDSRHQNLLLIGTGTGLAPLLGVVRDALRQGHAGAIHLYHGSRNEDGLYAIDDILALQEEQANFYYTPCLSGKKQSGFSFGRAHDVALSTITNLNNWRVYLCGHPEMVKETKKRAFISGAALTDIYADAFHVGS